MRTHSRFTACVLAAAVLFLPRVLSAQGNPVQTQCTSIIPFPFDPTTPTGARQSETYRFCNAVADGITAAQAPLGIALVGGNPLPGAGSTMGMRIGKLPRISVAPRFSTASVEMLPIDRIGSTNDVSAVVPALNADVGVGLFKGFSLFPTVGGFGSIDLVASVGINLMPERDGLRTSGRATWGVGARLGVLQESFKAPGVSITGMYRRTPNIVYGDRNSSEQNSYFDLSGNSVLSLRGIVGKRMFTFGAIAGFGYDRFTSDVSVVVRNPQLAPPNYHFTVDDFSSDRATAFGALHYTLLVLSLVGEVGWQKGGSGFGAPLPAGQTSKSESSHVYGSLALRLTI